MYMNIYVCLILFLIEIGYIINTPTLLPTRFTIYFCCFYFCAFHPATTTTTTTTTTTALPCVDNQPAFCSAPGVDVVICSNLDRAVKYCQKTCNKCGMWCSISPSSQLKKTYKTILGSGVFASGNK